MVKKSVIGLQLLGIENSTFLFGALRATVLDSSMALRWYPVKQPYEQSLQTREQLHEPFTNALLGSLRGSGVLSCLAQGL